MGAVLDSKQRRGRVGIRVAIACVVAALAVLTMSPMRMVAAPQSVGVSSTPAVRITVNGMLVIADVTVKDVPEPSTWVLMLLGFTGLGAAALRRSAGLTKPLA